MHPIMQALNPIISMLSSFFSLPLTIWDGVTKIIRSTVSLNGYTGLDLDGVLKESDVPKDDQDEAEEEGESKEENGGQTT